MKTVEQRDDNATKHHRARLAQLYKAISEHLDEKYIARMIIDHEIDVNFRIPDDFLLQEIRKSDLIGSTALHYAQLQRNHEAFDYLLKRAGADYTMKNAEGSTCLHKALESLCSALVSESSADDVDVRNSYIDSILEAHVRDGNFTNPRDNNGFSHFHAACLTNNAQAVELFLKNGVSANHTVNADSPVFPGYTPLHFAVACSRVNVEIAELLVEYGANCTIKDASSDGGTWLIHKLVQQQLKYIDNRNSNYDRDKDEDELAKELESIEKMLKLFMVKIDETDVIDDLGLSTFHIACTLRDTSLVESLLPSISNIDHCVKTTSPLWPGYTALHFAAISNIETVKLLLRNGANIETKNTQGISPFDMCLERYRIKDISYLISSHPNWKDIKFSDSDVKLTDFIDALHNTSKLIFMARNFHVTSSSSLPLDSPLWPGSTPLHLAVIFFDRNKARFHTKEDDDDDEDDDEDENDKATKVIEILLNSKYFEPISNVLAQDAYGRTSIHLAFIMQKRHIFRYLLERNDKIENPIDIDNFSLLHIACLLEKDHLIEALLFIGEDANMPILTDLKVNLPGCDVLSAGSTPLHIAVINDDNDAMKKLLASGADPFAQDVNGVSPIHRLIASGDESHCRIFTSSSDFTHNITVTGGVSYLHIACMANDRDAVKKLIRSGADVNAIINFEMPLDSYSTELVKLLTPRLGSSPLHFALQYNCQHAVEILIASGADLFAKIPEQKTIVHDILRNRYVKYANVLLLNLRLDENMRKNFENKTGLTLLHVACNAMDLTLVRQLLDNDEQLVNAQARLDSPVWPGCTPLHVLLGNLDDRLDRYGSSRNCHVDSVHVILKLLMDHGADVTIKNADDQTPVDISKKLYRSYIRAKTWLCTALPLDNHDYYDLNFVDDSGISLFQEACYENNITVVQEFLKRGVDVNQQVDAFAKEFAGYTALHFAAKQRWRSLIGCTRQLTTIEILLNHGADIHAKDLNDDTPLHIAVQRGSSRQDLISLFMKYGANVDAVNVHGKTPFGVLLRSSNVSSEEVILFLQNGVRINSYNCVTGMGYIPLLYDKYDIDFDSIITAIIDNTTGLTEADDKGRTVIHNIVSSRNGNLSQGELSELCMRFIERGCDIDQQDNFGRTALHTAIQWKNDDALYHLLKLNADPSIADNDGKTAVDYVVDMCTCEDNSCKNSTHGYMRHALAIQLVKLELTGFQEFTKYKDLKKICNEHDDRIQSYRKSLKKAKKTYIIPRELTLHDFASETGAVSSYLHMSLLKRNVVDEFFKSMDNERYGKVSLWLKNHYRKAVVRPTLIEPAKHSLNSLIGFSLPHVCSDNVFRFLSNVELKNLITANVADSNET